MPIDITVRPAAGRQLVERYGGGGFTVSGVRWPGSVLIFPDRTIAWPVAEAAGIDATALAPVLTAASRPRILVIGCGRGFSPRPEGLDMAMRDAGIGLEWMDTGAACRTFNVLLLEDREVAAALLAVE
ncbi:MAG TPA: Mth938-like domain-containing protein [Rhodospirillales bacterium]|nr:Mth938-like domain-containing protein [Rhodospirillales bacterium]